VKISALIRVGLQTAEEASPSMKNDLHRTAAWLPNSGRKGARGPVKLPD
jgi:hypothetical protein